MAFFSNALCQVKLYRAPIQETVRRTQASRSLFSPRCHFMSTRRPILGSATSASARSQVFTCIGAWLCHTSTAQDARSRAQCAARRGRLYDYVHDRIAP